MDFQQLARCLVFSLVLIAVAVRALCPPDCSCTLDQRGRAQVICTQGGIIGDIPVKSMNKDTEVIIISGPEDNKNYLRIGPIFKDFSQLEEIHIIHSNVPAIGKYSFWGMITLRVLNLTHNNISHLIDSDFRGLIALEELYLDDNCIESVTSAAFRHLERLKTLSLAQNSISELGPRIFYVLHELNYLDLSDNPLSYLNPEVFTDIRQLKIFRCRKCNLFKVNSRMYTFLQNLQLLDLRDNKFKHFTANEFRNLRTLRSLHLDGNELSVVVSHFLYEHPLEVLTLSRNRITDIMENAFLNVTLKELDLSYNKLITVRANVAVSISQSLRKLDISGNPINIKTVEFIIRNLPKLRILKIVDLDLRDILPDMFVDQKYIKVLNLSHNHLVRLPADALAPMRNLHMLDISNNMFPGFDDELLQLFNKLPKLHSIYLHGNPLTCDKCNIIPLVHWVKNNHKYYDGCKDFQSPFCIRCIAPSTMRGNKIIDLHPVRLPECGEDIVAAASVFRNETRFGLIFASVIIGILLLAILIILVVYKRHTAHYYTREDMSEFDDSFEKSPVFDAKVNFKPRNSSTPKTIASLATIDELTDDPDLYDPPLANGHVVFSN